MVAVKILLKTYISIVAACGRHGGGGQGRRGWKSGVRIIFFPFPLSLLSLSPSEFRELSRCARTMEFFVQISNLKDRVIFAGYLVFTFI